MSFRRLITKALVLLLMAYAIDLSLHKFLFAGLNRYYGISQEPEILINGSSMAMSGFNRHDLEQLTGMNIANYSHEGVTVQERYLMIRYFFSENPDGVRKVVYEVNPLIFSNARTAENVYTIFYPFLDNELIDTFVKSKAPTHDYMVNKIIRTKRYDARLLPVIIKGYAGIYDNVKTNKLDTNSLTQLDQARGTMEAGMLETNVSIFEETIKLIRSYGSGILLVMMPIYHQKLETFTPGSYSDLCNYFTTYASDNEGVEFINLNQDSMIYNPGYFSDPLHFNYYGQRLITGLIGARLMEDNTVP